MKKILHVFGFIISGLLCSAQSPRMSLYEEFTGENCGPCAGVNPGLDALLALPTNTSKCVAIKWQVPIPSAPGNAWSLYQTNKFEIDWRYKSTAAGGYGYNITSAPTGKMDGQSVMVFGASSDNPSNLTSNVIATAQSYSSAFNISMSRDWDLTCSSVNLTVNIQASANFSTTGNLVFRTVMVERHILFSTPPGSNGEMKFEDVAVKSFPTLQNGMTMGGGWIIGQTQTFILNCVIPSYIRKKAEIAFVGFIQDDGNRTIAQATLCGKQALPNDAMAVPEIMEAVCGNTFTPKVSIKNAGQNAITAMTVTPYVDGISGSQVIWSGNLAPSATTNLIMNTFNTPATIGAHTFSFVINAINNTDFDLTNNGAKVSFAVATSFQSPPISEGFVSGSFPPVGFTNVNPDAGPGWSRVNSSGLGGYGLTSESAKHEFYNNTVIGDKDELILPPVDLSGSNIPYLLFDIAYAQRTFSSNDKLEILASNNCGVNWTNVFSQSGQSLTKVAPYDGSEYFPGSSEWRTETVPLTGFSSPSVLIKFVTTNDNGNNIYIDNINLSFNSPVGILKNERHFDVALFPNPVENNANIKIVTDVSGSAQVRVINMIGQVVFENKVFLTAGLNLMKVEAGGFSKSIYSVIIVSEKGTVVKKLTVN